MCAVPLKITVSESQHLRNQGWRNPKDFFITGSFSFPFKVKHLVAEKRKKNKKHLNKLLPETVFAFLTGSVLLENPGSDIDTSQKHL